MDVAKARELARDVTRPCGLLGYLVGRGAWWPADGSLQRCKLAVGQVMGSTYVFLGPIWRMHPSLDPGQAPDALGPADQGTSLEDKPEDLRSLLNDLEGAVSRALPVLEEQLPSARHHFRREAAAVLDSIQAARQVVARLPPRDEIL